MTEKPTVSFNIMADMNVRDGYMQVLQNGIKFVFDNYFTNTNYELSETITQIPPYSPFKRFISENFTKSKNYPDANSYFNYYSYPPYYDFHIILTKNNIYVHIDAKYNIDGHSIHTAGKSMPIFIGPSNLDPSNSIYVFKIEISFKAIYNNPNPFMVFEDLLRHELLHCHYMFHFHNIFSDDHCPDKNCLMYNGCKYYNLSTPRDLCDSCKEKIKKFHIPDKILKNNIRKTLLPIFRNDETVNRLIQLYNKICPSH